VRFVASSAAIPTSIVALCSPRNGRQGSYVTAGGTSGTEGALRTCGKFRRGTPSAAMP
jgi:hypothetical protein